MQRPGEEKTIEVIEHLYAQPCKVELERLATGKYKWALSLHGEASQEMIDLLDKMDQRLRDLYLEAQG